MKNARNRFIARAAAIHFLCARGDDLSGTTRMCEHLSGRGEHGRHIGEDAPSRRRGFFRRRFPGGLAGQQDEAEVPGLEEETAAGQTVRDSEENRLGLSR